MKTKNRIRAAGIAVILVLTVVVNVLSLTVFDPILSTYLGGIKSTSGTQTLDGHYYKTAHSTIEEVAEAERQLNEQAAGEGIVLLKADEKSRLCPKKEITAGNFDAITALCCEASQIVKEVRK